MEELDSISSFSFKLFKCDLEHIEDAFNVLIGAVQLEKSTESIYESEKRKLLNNIRFSIKNEMCFIVYKDNTPVACATLRESDVSSIWNINIIYEYRASIASLLLNNYIINVKFIGKKVYIKSNNISTFVNSVECVSNDLYVINENLSIKLFILYKKFKG